VSPEPQSLLEQIAAFSGKAREMGTVSMPDTRLAATLLCREMVPEEQLQSLIAQSKDNGVTLMTLLLDNDILSEEQRLEASALTSGVLFIQLDPGNISQSTLMHLQPETARMHQAVPVSVKDNGEGRLTVTIALANPASAPAKNALSQYLAAEGKDVVFVAAHPDRIAQVIHSRYETMMDERDFEVVAEDFSEDGIADELINEENAGPARQYYANIFQEAVNRGASDVHFEVSPDGKNMLVRMRIDGVMHEQTTVPERYRRALVAVIKLDMDLDVADERRLKNGRVTKRIQGREVDFRGANWVTTRGEELVVRLLDKEGMKMDINKIGLSEHSLQQMKRGYDSSFGAIIVCGPTGSGKSSTLYSVLKEITTPEKVVLTIEDPVEYRMPGIQQAQVIPSLGRDFADTLRNAMRCDPDVIMVGEVRDEVTAEISMRAAISGHLLLTTLHAMEAAAAPIQLIRMGVPAYQVSDALRVVVSQRLVRLLCPSCRVPYLPEAEELLALEYDQEAAAQIIANAAAYKFHTHNPEGCSECTRGYRGRTLIAEVMNIGSQEKDLMMNPERSSSALRRLAIKNGMRVISHDGVEKAAHGLTSLAEVRRVVG